MLEKSRWQECLAEARYGVILLNGTNGGGYFLNKTNAGAVILEP
jgi:hypothetical protein